MAVGGGPIPSPWFVSFPDYLRRQVSITVNFDNTTRVLQNAVVHRDTGCRWTQIVIGDPNDATNVKVFTAPADGQGDVTVSAAQLAARGLNTIGDAMALQITAR